MSVSNFDLNEQTLSVIEEMDIQMPVMNGYESSRAIRNLDGVYFKKLPIIAISANAYDEDVKNCLEAGMNAHIAKPFNPDELLKTLYKLRGYPF